ncbi:MAG: hypothetical protein QXW41_03600 [Fervidicoccaceae archaeon]
MPSYSSHRRVYEIIGLSDGYCFVIDRIVDEDPPLVRDVFPDVGSMEVLPRHFGYMDKEFPYMAKFVLDRFGYEGLRCLAAHFVLDHIEGLVVAGFDSEMISNEVSALVESYIREASAAGRLGLQSAVVEGHLRYVLSAVQARLSDVLGVIREELGMKLLPVDVAVNASADIISLKLRASLIARGYKGKRGFRVSQSIKGKHYTSIYNKVKQLVRQKLYRAVVSKELESIDKLVESINKVKKLVLAKNVATVSEYSNIVRSEAMLNKDLNKLLEIIDKSIEETLEQEKL